MISIVCVYNDRRILEDYLMRSLKRQNAAFELLCIDNTDGRHLSAPAILNWTASGAKHDYIMFVHPDVELRSSTWLSDVEAWMEKLKDSGAAGVAGKDPCGNLHASIWQGSPARFIGPGTLRVPMEVQTLDGCLLIVPRSVFRRVRFDQETCTGWHLYVADYCLALRRFRYKVHVLPNAIYHKSHGPADCRIYEKTVSNMIRKYRGEMPTIYTTVGEWSTDSATPRPDDCN